MKGREGVPARIETSAPGPGLARLSNSLKPVEVVGVIVLAARGAVDRVRVAVAHVPAALRAAA
jgi:hypothetical protein